MANYTKPILVGLLFSTAAFGFTAEQMNARGNAIIVADVTPEPKPSSVDVAKYATKAPGATMGEVTSGIVANQSMGTRIGTGAAAGLIVDILTAPVTHDSRRHIHRIIYTNGCKLDKGFSNAEETDVSALVPGQIAHWIEPLSGKGLPTLAVLIDADGKLLSPIDSSHPCFAAYEAARLAEEAKRSGVAR